MKRMLFVLVPIITVASTPAPAEAATSCSRWDIEQACCPSACAVSKGHNWPMANDMLRACMQSLGCSTGDVQGATIYTKCDCR